MSHVNQIIGKYEIVNKRRLKNNETTMNNGFFTCRPNESCDGIVLTFSISSSSSSSVFLTDETFKNELTHAKRQSRKKNALASIKIAIDAQRKHNVESDSQSFSITISKIEYQIVPVSCAPEINDLEINR